MTLMKLATRHPLKREYLTEAGKGTKAGAAPVQDPYLT